MTPLFILNYSLLIFLDVGIFLVFIMKSTCCLAVFYLFYRLLLSRDTFHRFNRMALLSVIAFSIAIPFIRLVADEPAVVQRTVLDIERLLQMAGTPAQEEAGELPFWLAALFMVYAGGCLFSRAGSSIPSGISSA